MAIKPKIVALAWIFSVLIVGIGMGFASAIFVCIGPSVRYQRRTPSLEPECQSIPKGIELSEVETLIEQDAPPGIEWTYENQFSFSRENGDCTVELDKNRHVTSTHVKVVHSDIGVMW
jgi:hypothetical protein